MEITFTGMISCDANSKAWQRNNELNKPIPATKRTKIAAEEYLSVLEGNISVYLTLIKLFQFPYIL